MDTKAKNLDVNPQTVCANTSILFKIARKISVMRQQKDTDLTFDKIMCTLSNENEEEKLFLDSMDQSE